MIEVFKSIFLGIVEGITEWLPISSTGHIILVDEFLNLGVSEQFKNLYDVVIQLGAIMAVVVLFWNKLWPFTSRSDSSSVYKIVGKVGIKRPSLTLWLKVAVACIPAAVIGFFIDDWADEHLYNSNVVAGALIVYGIAFIIIEALHKNKEQPIASMHNLSYKTAFFIGLFQILAFIPGTSRSGATILGAMILGVSRTVSAEFSFYLAVPIMFGASFLKTLKYILEYGFSFSAIEFVILFAGMISAFLVSIIAIKFFLGYIRKKDFTAFGYYRIALGLLVILYFLVIK
ncbi:MAG: undecaprenyl-diphosphate phosphatase [Clostridiales bacterium]|nr:undecaprenyl-diphosphate phosphatase [Candidatus Equinaster intestinalis]